MNTHAQMHTEASGAASRLILRVLHSIIYSRKAAGGLRLTSESGGTYGGGCTHVTNREVDAKGQIPVILCKLEKRGISPVNYKRAPGSLLPQFLSRFGSLVDYLLAVGVFNHALV